MSGSGSSSSGLKRKADGKPDDSHRAEDCGEDHGEATPSKKRPAGEPADDSGRAQEAPASSSPMSDYNAGESGAMEDASMETIDEPAGVGNEMSVMEHSCDTCRGRFHTRSQLYKHLRRMQHFGKGKYAGGRVAKARRPKGSVPMCAHCAE